jgi:hypothetical protein
VGPVLPTADKGMWRPGSDMLSGDL